MSDHPTDALVEKLPIPLSLRWAGQQVAREWYDENVAPLVEAAGNAGVLRDEAWDKWQEVEAKLNLVRLLLGNTLYNVEQTEPGCESEQRLRESLARTAEGIGLSREKGWR